MTAQIFDLAAERAKRRPSSSRLAPEWTSVTTLNGYYIDVFKLNEHWAFHIDRADHPLEWYSERHYASEVDARADAVRAVRQMDTAQVGS